MGAPFPADFGLDAKRAIEVFAASHGLFLQRSIADDLAVFSTAKNERHTHRYLLLRAWDPRKPLLHFVMLNPSTADAFINDPTITRVCDYAQRWGYGGVIVTNLYAIRSTDPAAIYRDDPEPVGALNDDVIRLASTLSALTVCGWGNHGMHAGRADAVMRGALSGLPLHCIAINRTGQPVHPLYQRKDATPSALRGIS